MKVSAIICEYNPMHNGHRYQIEKTLELTDCDATVAVMSGNFVQRGEPAIIDKWKRTLMALTNGIDLVIELPALYSLSSAEYFADGAVKVLNSLNTINSVCFGSECGNVDFLYHIANILYNEPLDYKLKLKEYLCSGYTYPLARSKALIEYINSEQESHISDYEELLKSSNNILGIEYCKALIKNQSNITPYTTKRIGASYNSEAIENIFSSATAIRKHLKSNSDIGSISEQLPASVIEIIEGLVADNYNFTFPESMFKYIKYKSISDKFESLKKLPDSNEGLHYRIYKYLKTSDSLENLIQGTKTKRYTYTRISRILTQYFIGFEQYNIGELLRKEPYYIRVLGLNSKGAEILRQIKKNSNVPIISKLPNKITNPILELDILSTAAYSILNPDIRYNHDYLQSPLIL